MQGYLQYAIDTKCNLKIQMENGQKGKKKNITLHQISSTRPVIKTIKDLPAYLRREKDNFEEIHPKQEDGLDEPKEKWLEHHKEEIKVQDSRKSKFSHKKFLVLERISFIMTLLIFFLSCLKTQVDLLMETNRYFALCIMNTISLCTISLMFIIVTRYLCLFQLKVNQLKVYYNKEKQKKQMLFLTFLKKSDNLGFLMLQLILILPHPISLLDGVLFQLYQTYNQTILNHSLNDILAMLLLCKVYIIIRALVNTTIYASPTSSRLCHQSGIDQQFMYSVKCILNESPLRAILVIFIISMILFGNALKLSQGLLALSNDSSLFSNGFEKYDNCFWCVFITMSTVGYGDYFPHTIPGRLTMLSSAIAGVLLSSLLIVSLNAYLEMKPSQAISHITLLRLGQQTKLNKQASEALAETIKITHIMRKDNKLTDPVILQKAFDNLKNKIDSVKRRSKEIKSLIDTNNIIQEMNRLFYILKDNLKDIYKKQKEIQIRIKNIQVNKENKINFSKGMDKMLERLL